MCFFFIFCRLICLQLHAVRLPCTNCIQPISNVYEWVCVHWKWIENPPNTEAHTQQSLQLQLYSISHSILFTASLRSALFLFSARSLSSWCMHNPIHACAHQLHAAWQYRVSRQAGSARLANKQGTTTAVEYGTHPHWKRLTLSFTHTLAYGSVTHTFVPLPPPIPLLLLMASIDLAVVRLF